MEKKTSTKRPPPPRTGAVLSEETKRKISEKLKGRKKNPEREAVRIANLKKAVIGTKRTPEQKEKIRQGVLAHIAEQGRKASFKMTLGEQAIAKYLDSRGYHFIAQFRIPELGGHPYDFGIPSMKILIEFDGNHHWNDSWMYSDPEMKRLKLLETQQKDFMNTYLAEMFGYKVVRIYGINQPGDSYHGSLKQQLTNAGYGYL